MVAQIAEPITRFNMDADMPRDLEARDLLAYRLGYGRGSRTYVRKYGAPVAQHDGPAPAAGTPERRALGVQLANDMREHQAERHPSAHRAGMSALNKARKLRGAEPIADPAKPARKAPVRKLSAVPDVAPDPAPVKRKTRAPKITAAEAAAVHVDGKRGRVEKVDTTDAHRTRKLARRELAAAMRERGEDPRNADAWAAAKIAAGVK